MESGYDGRTELASPLSCRRRRRCCNSPLGGAAEETAFRSAKQATATLYRRQLRTLMPRARLASYMISYSTYKAQLIEPEPTFQCFSSNKNAKCSLNPFVQHLSISFMHVLPSYLPSYTASSDRSLAVVTTTPHEHGSREAATGQRERAGWLGAWLVG